MYLKMILITRPKLEAKKLKKIIEDLGYAGQIDSLSNIYKSNFDNNITSKKMILISSQQAAKIFIEKHVGQLNIPLLVIGNASYQKLESFGFSKILYKAKDSDELIKYLIKNYSRLNKYFGSQLVYMTGSVSNQKFINKLKEIGYKIEKKIIYKTIFKNALKDSTVHLLKNKKIKACLIYSQQNAEQFCNLVAKKNLYPICKNLLILTLSRNISQIMKKNGFYNVRHSLYPTQASLIIKLKKTVLL